MSESPHKVAVSISYGDVMKDKFIETTHMLSYSDIALTEEEAKNFKKLLIALVCQVVHKRTQKEVMGIYKEEKNNG